MGQVRHGSARTTHAIRSAMTSAVLRFAVHRFMLSSIVMLMAIRLSIA